MIPPGTRVSKRFTKDHVNHGRVVDDLCRWPGCKHDECTTVRWDGAATTNNYPASALTIEVSLAIERSVDAT